ncbi:hypothetical protein M0D69_16860 [Caballeronia sp. SEWSISQ10-4 2]|uniref:hypothetical protein n=1 Tax=Caballeronia sp. SEWSISQ10-4 2 TaxID=2937438 RepID=UPI00264B045C|nr:hypothetical protein [Caballeronia sp. SEWSISQ10-4 2]MDN7179628.1 hypothetical protein [Caballeronia sp. SEWSISQ10-4 2]
MDASSIAASLLGTRLTLWLGPTIAVPAPAVIVQALASVEVRLSDGDYDGFELTFTVGRTSALAMDYTLMMNPLLRPSTRVVIQVWLGVFPQVLIDGFITESSLNPGDEPGSSTLTVTGLDLRMMMDVRQMSMFYPAQAMEAIIEEILLPYMMYLGMPPQVESPDPSVPPPSEWIPVKADTDLVYLTQLAHKYDCVFYVEPTTVPMINKAYWGPVANVSVPQAALSVNMGPETNATIRFRYDGRAPTLVNGMMLDKRTGLVLPVITAFSTRMPLAVMPPVVVQGATMRMSSPAEANNVEYVEAMLQAQAQTNRSSYALKAEGELDMLRYGNILRPRRLVGVRGAGYMFDGLYYVKDVTHTIKVGEYKQRFTLTRDGFGSLTPVVPT